MLQEAVDVYIATLSARECERGSEDATRNSKNTIMAYRNDLNQLCTFLMQRNVQDWSQVTGEEIEGYLREMREAHAYRPTTVARKLASLKSFFRYLYLKGSLVVDPLEAIESPKVPRRPPRILSAEEIGSLFSVLEVDTASGKRDLAMLHMLCSTGMRASELVSLDLSDFDPQQGLVCCPGTGLRPGNRRILTLTDIAVEAMLLYIRAGRPRLVRQPEEPALFLNHHGDRLTRQGFWLIIKSYARLVGISSITPHVLRNSFAIAMLQEGVELRSLQAILGHAHISTTQAYRQLAYAHLPST